MTVDADRHDLTAHAHADRHDLTAHAHAGAGLDDAAHAAEHQQRLQRALDLAYAYVNRRDRTVEEVNTQLARKGVSDSLREAAVRTLVDQGLVDDERFARLFVSDKRQLEQWGADRIRRGLLARGIERELAEAALSEAPDGWTGETTSELDRALAVLRRRFPHPPRGGRERERALGMLLRKGYDSELALDALAAHARGD